MTLNGQYADFPAIGAAVLQMMARNHDIVLHDDDARQTLAAMRSLPAHPDVQPALERLRAAGHRLATLTNSSQAGVQAQLQHAGLAPCFERQLSVQAVQKFKPDPAVYAWAAREVGEQPQTCMLVAAHGWDVAGAKWAGMQAAFIAREGQQMFPLAPAPDLDVADLAALADALGA
jgi:2-haloacid dehalogenase